jgi:hypothetical protein
MLVMTWVAGMGRLDLKFGGHGPEADLRRSVRCSWLVAVRDQQPEPGGNIAAIPTAASHSMPEGRLSAR